MKDIKRIDDKKILYVFTVCIMLFIPLLIQTGFYLVKFNIINNYDNIDPTIVFYITIPFLIYTYIKNTIKRKLDIYDYLFYILIIVGIIVSIFAINSKISFIGKNYRHEGFVALCTYYLLFINWKIIGNKEYIKKILKFIILFSIINSIFALMQIYTSFNFITRYTLDKQMASGIICNPNFLGSLIVTSLSIIITKFLLDKNISIKQIILIILFYITLINTQSTGPFIAIIITIIFIIIYLIIKKKIIFKKMIYLILLLFFTHFLIMNINNNVFNIKKCELCDLNSSIRNEEKNNYTIMNGRLDIWKNVLYIIKDNILTGVGYDNLHYAYHKDIDFNSFSITLTTDLKQSNSYSIVDKAHNEYLHVFVSSGLIGIIPYLLLLFLTFIKGLKSNTDIKIILLSGFVAYSIQAFGNISVIQVAPIYYVIIGSILSKE